MLDYGMFDGPKSAECLWCRMLDDRLGCWMILRLEALG